MTNEKMTIHEALAELKMLDNRITKKINESCFAVSNKCSNTKINGKPISAFIDKAEKSYQSINDMIRRRSAIRCALSKSNAETKVVINDVEYSVAEAIEMKRTGISMLRCLLEQLESQYGYSKNECSRNNMRVDENADKQVQAIYGTKEKVSTPEAMSMRQAYIEANKMEPVVLKDIEDRIDDIKQQIDKFVVAVDSKLSVSNALTVIEIEY